MSDGGDFGYFGKGASGYAHYNEAYKRDHGGGGGGNGGCGCLFWGLIILILAIATNYKG